MEPEGQLPGSEHADRSGAGGGAIPGGSRSRRQWKREFKRDAERTGRKWHVRDNQDFMGPRRINFCLVASRWPILNLEEPSAFCVPHPERVLAVTIDVDGHPLQLVNTHVLDGSSYKWGKIDHFEGLLRLPDSNPPA